MQRKHNKDIVPTARMLRKSMTPEERHLWYDFLRSFPVRFYRQKVLGKYIADFYCAEAKLVVELDGSQHYTERGRHEDAVRTEFLEGYDLKVIRFSNRDVKKAFDWVCNTISKEVTAAMGTTPPTRLRRPTSPCTGEAKVSVRDIDCNDIGKQS